MKDSGSRWDGLRENDDAPSSAAKPPTHGHIPRFGDGNNLPRNSRHIRASSRENASTLGRSWRRPQKSNSNTDLTAEDENVRHAIESLKSKLLTYVKNTDSNCGSKSVDEGINKAIGELLISVHGSPDPSCFLERTSDWNSTRDQSVISTLVLWEGADATIRSLRQLVASKSCALLIQMSTVTAAFLQMIHDNIQNSCSATAVTFQRPRSMTDLRLCECASILLDFLSCDVELLDTDQMSLIDYKEILFTCLAKILGISTMLGMHASNSKNIRSLLFPWGAEKTVNLVVKQSVLPYVRTVMEDSLQMACSMKMKHCHHAMECIYLLLRDPSGESHSSNHQLSKHAAAILAPLVIDVDPDGRENQRSNPLRSSTLNAIVTFWNCSYQMAQEEHPKRVDYEIEIACQCLISALNSLHALRKRNTLHSGNESPPVEIDVATLSRQIQSLLQIEHLACHHSVYLKLLTSLCQTYPAAAASQWHVFLEQSTAQVVGTTAAALPLLISFVEDGTAALNHRNFRSKPINLLPGALRAIVMLLLSMPFSHWIAEEEKSLTKVSGQKYFASRVRNSMIRVIACANSLMHSIRNFLLDMGSNNMTNISINLMDSIMTCTSQLAGKLCTILPFSGRNSVMLGPASKLVGCSGEIYVLCTKVIEDSASLHPTSVGLKLHEKACNSFSYVLMGTVDINSTTEKTAATTQSPVQHWISDCSSFEFIELLLSSKPTSFEGKRTAMLSHVARICPWALAQEPFNLASFCELCTTKCDDPEHRVSGVKLVESFLIGRHMFSSEFSSFDMSTVIVDTFCPTLLLALKHPNATIRAAGVNSFSYMLEADWVTFHSLSNEVSSLDWHYIDAVLRMCLNDCGESDSKVRCAACKAIGDISTCILKQCHHTNNNGVAGSQFTHEFGIAFSHKICHKMEHVLKDECSSVRSMGIFAIGNVAHALKKQRYSSETILPLLPQLKASFSSVCACLDGKDDKVIINAIRSIAHLSHFAYSPDFLSTTKSFDFDLYKDTISNLTIKVKRAVDDVTEGPSTHLTWNQRSNIKKHAWGSCTTIGVLLTFSNAVQQLDSIFIDSILSELFRCVQVSNAIHDKIAAAAVHSLVTLPNSFWQELPGNCSSIGFGLACCFCYLSNASQQKLTVSSHISDINYMTRILLSSAKSKDFSLLLMRDDIPFSVDHFYQWLVTNNINAEVMEEIAIAAQSEEVQNHLDVSMVQMFMSRTILQTKKQASPRKPSLIDFIDDFECDEI